MTLETLAANAHVYLRGDPGPLETTLEVSDVAGRLLDMQEAKRGAAGPVFVRLPMPDGREALVSPSAVAAIVPPPEGD
jgi:hypothetical protein